ncbi:hypothetical protein [Ruegeria sp. HKCCD7318]|uniref:hypothetical protein n=1 Tax=Ruegeria sp. HKCCD7318 TaxID=2683014 RepID=UPI001492E9EB|nr:hypothetical protein [Ruegeria sp. HKCCD7318]NOE36255.1 hypothetical protein [Ruegeria sp. HKCCD7318]
MREKDNIIEGSGSVYKDIGIPDPTVSLVFCDLRIVAVRGQFYPIEIAVLRVVDDKPRTWSSHIYPALPWSTQILDASPVDLSTAPPAVDVANQTLDLIESCAAGWIYSDSSATAGLIDRLLAETDAGYMPKVDILPANQMSDEMRDQLKTNRRISDDPTVEVERLWTCYQATKEMNNE